MDFEYPKVRLALRHSARILVLTVYASFNTGCNTEGRIWEDASSANTIQAYEDFLVRFPDGQFKDPALERIESLRLDAAFAANDFEGYSRFLSDYPATTRRSEVEARLDSLVNERISQSFISVFMASSPGPNILAPAIIDASKYQAAREALEEVLRYAPNNALANNNRAVLAVEEGDFESAQNLFGRAVATAVDEEQVYEVALRIQFPSSDGAWLSTFHFLQAADLPSELFPFAKRRDGPQSPRDPLTVTVDVSTPGAPSVKSLSASPCPHVIVDDDKPTFLLKTEIENNVRALDALQNPSERRRCR